jgi:hypothetical protein
MENRIKGQSDTSVDFNNRIAASCVQAAEDMTKLFPDEPDEEYIYEQGPWWCIIHYIMQAIAVFLLEIAYQAAHTGPNRRTEILWCIKKLLKWLRCLMPENPVAERANKVVLDILKGCPEGMRRDFSDILADEFSESFRNHPDSPTQNSFYDWNLDPQSRLSATMHPNMSMLPHIQYLGSIENQGVEGAYDSNGSGESNAESGDKWWSGDLGFQLPSTYGNPFQTTFDQVNPLSTSLDELYGIYLDDLPDDDAQQQQG